MEKIRIWFNKPTFTLVCYVLAILLLGYTLFIVKNSYDYISLLVVQGNVSWVADIKDIFSYFVDNSVSYLFYAFSFIFFGKVINILKSKSIKEKIEINEENTSVKEIMEADKDLVEV